MEIGAVGLTVPVKDGSLGTRAEPVDVVAVYTEDGKVKEVKIQLINLPPHLVFLPKIDGPDKGHLVVVDITTGGAFSKPIVPVGWLS